MMVDDGDSFANVELAAGSLLSFGFAKTADFESALDQLRVHP